MLGKHIISMSKKNILLVSNAFYPEISPRSFRATELAKEFYRQGHKVTVISKYRDHDYSSFLQAYPIGFKMWKKSMFMTIPQVKARGLNFLVKGFFRALSILFEYPAILDMFQVKRMLKHEKDYDLMISFAVPFPVHWGVARSRNRNHRIADKWVADCGDPFMFARLDTFRKPFYFKPLELSFCRKCDYISIPFKQLDQQFYPQFKAKMRVIPQGFNFNEIRLDKTIENTNKPVFMFAGSVIPGLRDLNMFLDFLCSYPKDFLFVVYTNQREYFANYKKNLGAKLEIRGYIDRISLIYEMSKANFLINVDTVHDTENNVEAIPSKLIDYALSERPILNLNSAGLDKENTLRFLQGDYTGRRIINKDNFNITTVAHSFLHLL